MKTVLTLFGATRYWEGDTLQSAAKRIEAAIGGFADETILAVNGDTPEVMPAPEDICVIVPMSGAVQAALVAYARRFRRVILFAGYVAGNFEEALCTDMLRLNAAPTTMDSWAVLKRDHPSVSLCTSVAALADKLEMLKVLPVADIAECAQTNPGDRMDNPLPLGKLLLIGDIEPWVVSASRDLSAYARVGIAVEPINADELEALFHATSTVDAAPLTAHFAGKADALVEPNQSDVETAARLAAALEALIRGHNADGAAIACFNLIPRLGTTSCLAVSHINESTPFIAACEGDLDSAVTMLLLKRVTSQGVWMANPNLQPDGTINFTHCTAPLSVCGAACGFRLRNHHESGKGVSPEVYFPTGRRVTLCRFSAAENKMTVQTGTSESGATEQSCRTQLRVRPDDFGRYIKTALGCHQVIAFEDVGADMRAAGAAMGVEVL